MRSNIPQPTKSLTPQWPYLDDFRHAEDQFKRKQKRDYDTCHGTRSLPEIPNSTEVWVTTDDSHSPGHVNGSAGTPRSYLVETPSGQVRRNRAHLTVVPNGQPLERLSKYSDPSSKPDCDQVPDWYQSHCSRRTVLTAVLGKGSVVSCSNAQTRYCAINSSELVYMTQCL